MGTAPRPGREGFLQWLGRGGRCRNGGNKLGPLPRRRAPPTGAPARQTGSVTNCRRCASQAKVNDRELREQSENVYENKGCGKKVEKLRSRGVEVSSGRRQEPTHSPSHTTRNAAWLLNSSTSRLLDRSFGGRK